MGWYYEGRTYDLALVVLLFAALFGCVGLVMAAIASLIGVVVLGFGMWILYTLVGFTILGFVIGLCIVREIK